MLGGEECPALPLRGERHFDRIEVVYAPREAFREHHFFAASDLRYELLDPAADISCLCDADTVLVRPLPNAFLEEMKARPALCGVVAHYPFPISRDTRDDPEGGGLYRDMPQAQAWERLGQIALGRPIRRSLRYTLLEGVEDDRCPFYINYGFLAAPANLLVNLHQQLKEIQPVVRRLLRNDFYGKLGLHLPSSGMGSLGVRCRCDSIFPMTATPTVSTL